jgi:type II secretory pathway pseudopilin PulG
MRIHFSRLAARSVHGGRAFTLVEVILAIGITTALLIVALVFYRQAADLRTQILQESERLASIRLVLDLMAGDLRAALGKADPGNEFQGDSSSLRFVKTALTTPSLETRAFPAQPSSDLVRISFSAQKSLDGTNEDVTGLVRLEEPLGAVSPAVSSLPLIPAPVVADGVISTNPPTAVQDTNFTDHLEAHPVEPLTDVVHFVRFRYWNGFSWQSGWTNASPPRGVEILLSTESLANDATAEAYPPEPIRRVVYLANGTTLSRTNLEDFDLPLIR